MSALSVMQGEPFFDPDLGSYVTVNGLEDLVRWAFARPLSAGQQKKRGKLRARQTWHCKKCRLQWTGRGHYRMAKEHSHWTRHRLSKGPLLDPRRPRTE